MSIGIDHIVIAVRDLDETSRDYTEAGFTVVPGGEHHSGSSHNALVAFQDGSYFELIAFKDSGDPGAGPWAAKLRETGEGLVDYALRTDDLDREIEQLTTAGLTVVGPTHGGRVRPDGQRIDWRTIRFSDPSLPFYCHDETARPLRVPDGAQAIHAIGVTGVASIAVPVSSIETSSDVYRKLTGTDGNDIATGRRFAVGNQAIDLVEAAGDRPLEVVLVAPTRNRNVLPEHLTHGARLVIGS